MCILITLFLVAARQAYPGLPYSSNPAMSFSAFSNDANPPTSSINIVSEGQYHETGTLSDQDTFTDALGKQFLAYNDNVEVDFSLGGGTLQNNSLSHDASKGLWTRTLTIKAPTVGTNQQVTYTDTWTFKDDDGNVTLHDADQQTTILVTVSGPTGNGGTGG